MPAEVLELIELPENAGSVVLCDWMAAEVQDGRNLLRTDQSGRVLWKARPPQTGDCFVGIQWDGQALRAHTWSGYLVSVDIGDGSVIVTNFTK
jgi:hypothetical protein